MTPTPKPWFETDAQKRVVLNLPFDDGHWMKLVLGNETPDWQVWLKCDDQRKALCARWYIAALEGCPASSAERDAIRRERHAAAMAEVEAWCRAKE